MTYSRIDRDDALELARRFVEQPLAEIQVAEIVVRLDVHLVALQHRPVVQQRLLEIAGALVVERELELVWRAEARAGARRAIRRVRREVRCDGACIDGGLRDARVLDASGVGAVRRDRCYGSAAAARTGVGDVGAGGSGRVRRHAAWRPP